MTIQAAGAPILPVAHSCTPSPRFTSLPEPCFESSGKPRRPRLADGTWRALLLVLKLGCLGAVLSVVLRAPRPFDERRHPKEAGGWPSSTLEWLHPMAHLWLIYLWASSCLDISTLLVNSSGAATEPGFRNPLLASRSLREAWGDRWNRPVHVLLKRSVYVPARRRGLSATSAAIVTFFASGLLHEYNFSIHNASAYEPGRASLFFLLMGSLMLLEVAALPAFNKLLPRHARELFHATPSAIIALGLQVLVLPAFAPLFMRSWVGSGMIEAVGSMVLHAHCDDRAD